MEAGSLFTLSFLLMLSKGLTIGALARLYLTIARFLLLERYRVFGSMLIRDRGGVSRFRTGAGPLPQRHGSVIKNH